MNNMNDILSNLKPKTLFLEGKRFRGYATFINGYNGYDSTEDDGMLCALGDHGCWDATGKPNALIDENGESIILKSRRGVTIFVD